MLPEELASAAAASKPKPTKTSTGPKAPVAAPPASAPVSTPQPPLTVSSAVARAVPSSDERRTSVAADLAMPKPTTSDQLTSQLSESALSPVQVALQQAYSGEPLRIEGSGIDTMLDAYNAPRPVDPEEAKKQEAAQSLADRRDRRETALAAGSRNKEQRIINQIRQTTEGQYARLTPEQRAAFDFNRMLVAAVHKDRKLQDKYDQSDLERTTYEEGIDKVFGEDSPKPDIIAPETLGLLRQVGYHDDAATLDDFLNLDAAIGRKQIERMAPETIQLKNEHTGPLAPGTNPAPGLSPLASEKDREKFNLAQALAHDTQAISAAVANSQPLQEQITQVFQTERNDDVTQLGGVVNKVKPAVGYGDAKYDQNGVPQDLNSYFQLAFERIASKQMDAKTVLADANAMLSPEEFSQFHSYMANRAINAQRYELPLGANPEAKYMKPEQFIKLLNLDQPGGE